MSVAVEPRQTRNRLGQQILTRFVAKRPFLPVSRNRAVDDGGVDLADVVVGQSKPLDDPGSEVLDHHIGMSEKRLYFRHVGGILQVCGVTLFVAIDRMEERRVTIEFQVRDVEPSAQITAIRSFDLDHARTQIGQPQSAGWTSQELTEIDDNDAV